MSGVTDGTNPADAAELTGLAAGKIAIAPLTNGSFRVDQLPEAAFENLLVVSLGTGPTRIEEAVREAGHEPKKVGVVPVSGTELSYDGPMWTSDHVGPNDLTGKASASGKDSST